MLHGRVRYFGEVFLDSNGNGVYDRGIDSRKYYNEACGQQYSITGQDSVMPAKNAFVVGLVRKCDTCMEL